MTDMPDTPWREFLRIVANPYVLLQSSVEYGMAWFFTRPWGGALLYFLPALVVLLTTLTLVSIGELLSNNYLLTRYSLLVDQENLARQVTDRDADSDVKNSTSSSAADDQATAASVEPNDVAAPDLNKVSAYAEMLLRRVLQLKPNDNFANYVVAAQMGARGRIGQARYMMRQIAPVDFDGYALAHAWLAEERIRQPRELNDQERKELLHDLEVASSSRGIGPRLVLTYASLLEGAGRASDAIAVLSKSVPEYPELKVSLAELLFRNNRRAPGQTLSTEAKAEINERVESGKATASDFARLAYLYLLDNDADKAIEAALEGLTREPDSTTARRLVSDGYLLKFRLTARVDSSGTDVDLGFLDAALKADPTNPRVTEEVAQLLAIGESASPELVAALEDQLVKGRATALTHLLLSMRNLKSAEYNQAIPHLELALRQAPNQPIILNNLSLALARSNPDSYERSLSLIDRAVEIDPQQSEFRDTQGEIRTLSGDVAGSIESYETAIRLDPARLETREKLAQAYETFGLVDLAKAQRREIENRQNSQDAVTPVVTEPAAQEPVGEESSEETSAEGTSGEETSAEGTSGEGTSAEESASDE